MLYTSLSFSSYTFNMYQHRIRMISTIIFLLILLSSAKCGGRKGPKGEPPHKKEIKELESRIQEQIVQEVSKLKADLSENMGMFKAARTRLMNEIEALKSDNRNQTIRISQLEDLMLKRNKSESTAKASSNLPKSAMTTDYE